MARLLEAGEVPEARQRLSHLCARDATTLDSAELTRAATESIAENTSDAVVAPLFWGAVAGLPGLLGYRALNTLDAMVGYRSPRYRRFGWAAARADDVVNLAPSRIGGALTALCAPLAGGRARSAWRVWRRDGGRHPSPNAGQVEAAFAGALDIRLGGTNSYGGEVESRARLGEGRDPEPVDLRRAVRLSRLVGRGGGRGGRGGGPMSGLLDCRNHVRRREEPGHRRDLPLAGAPRVRVAPFKAQNMSNNSMVCADGAEIGRAQWLQARAARVEPEAAMNPVLLKPGSDRRSHVVALGKPFGTLEAGEYATGRAGLAEIAFGAFQDLSTRYDVVVCEGAGSPAEINLRGGDYVNMGLARRFGLPVLVVGDIDRGGVMAAMFGTLALLSAEDQALVAGWVVNKFRGDVGLLRPGLDSLEKVTGRPVLGVLPWLDRVWIDSEDALAAAGWRRETHGGGLHVAVVRFPRASNATDVDALAAEPGVTVTLTADPDTVAAADVVVLPGSRATVDDLAWLRDRGLDTALAARGRQAGPRHLRWLPDARRVHCGRRRKRRGRGPGPRPAARAGDVRPGEGARPPVRANGGAPRWTPTRSTTAR